MVKLFHFPGYLNDEDRQLLSSYRDLMLSVRK